MSKKHGEPNFLILLDTLKEATGAGFWERKDLSAETAGSLQPFFENEDTLGVLISGSYDIAEMHQYMNKGPIMAGIDRIRIERNPKPGEPELNVEHFVVGKPQTDGYCPVWKTDKETGPIPHWINSEYIASIKVGKESIEH